jgi:hypothetical protein
MTLSDYLADQRNATNDGRDARTIDSLGPKEIDAITGLIAENRLIAEPDELKALARLRKEQRSTPRLEPTTLSGALVQDGIKDIASLDLDEIQTLWERIIRRSLEATPDERKQLGQRRRQLLNESRTLKTAVAGTGAGSIADLALADVMDLWDRVAEGALTAEPEERKQLGERRKSRIGGSSTLAFELELEGVKDIASLDASAVEESGTSSSTTNCRSRRTLRSCPAHRCETGDDVRLRKLERWRTWLAVSQRNGKSGQAHRRSRRRSL